MKKTIVAVLLDDDDDNDNNNKQQITVKFQEIFAYLYYKTI
jgi:hypothetical protein